MTERRSGCPLNAALEIFGDRWTLLVVRDLMFKGRSRFKEFLEGGEGIATNILTDRLRRLEEMEIVARSPDPADRRKLVYRLTAKGMDLAPVLLEMIVWGAKYEKTQAPPALIREMTEQRERFLSRLRQAGSSSEC